MGVDVSGMYRKDGQILGTWSWRDELLPHRIWTVRDDSHSLEGGIGSYPLEEEHQERE
jgi:hypothetical protein